MKAVLYLDTRQSAPPLFNTSSQHPKKKSTFNLVAKFQYAIFPGYYPATNWASFCVNRQRSLICQVGATLEVIATMSRNQQLTFRWHVPSMFEHSH